MNAPFPIRSAGDAAPPSIAGGSSRAGEAIKPVSNGRPTSPLPALHVKQGVRIFKDQRADYDFLKLQQTLAAGAGIYCLLLSLAPIGAFAGTATFVIGALALAGAYLARRRADSILQRSMAASLVEEGPDVLAEAA